MADAVRVATRVEDPGSGAIPGGGIFETWKVFDAEVIASTGAKESIISPTALGFKLGEYHYFGLWVKATSVSATADVKVEIQESYDDTAANYIEPSAGSVVVASLSNEVANVYTLTPSPMGFMRIQVTGVASNPADTVVTAYLFMQT